LDAAVRQVVEAAGRHRAATLTGALLLAIAPPGLGLTLGEVNVRSAIGQRLAASVPVRTADGESLVKGCVAVRNGTSGLNGVRQAEVTTPQAGKPGDYTLELTTIAPLYEPMYELELRVDCPGAPAVVRQYVLMLDLPGSRYAADLPLAPPATAPELPAASDPVPMTGARPTLPAARNALAPDASALATGLKYRVREGDTLSSIAARVQGRRESIWALADRIFAANPQAFIRGDANLIRLGVEIVIPDATAVGPAATAAAPAEIPAPPTPLPQVPPALQALPAVPAPATGEPAPAASSAAPDPELNTAMAGDPLPAAVLPPARPAASRPATPAPVKKASQPRPAPAQADAPSAAPASPLAATIAGVVFGLVVSALLWLGRNLPSRTPWRNPRRSTAPAARPQAVEPARPAPIPIPVPAHRPLPSFTVSYSAAEDDPLAREFAPPEPPAASQPGKKEITAELEQLFVSTGTGADAGKTVAARAFGAPAAADIGEPAEGVDVLLGDDGATINAPAPAAARGATGTDPLSDSGTIDLHALASATGGRQQEQARDLMDALNLLERDYEEELTASQVLDLSAMRQALANAADPGDEVDEEATTVRQNSR